MNHYQGEETLGFSAKYGPDSDATRRYGSKSDEDPDLAAIREEVAADPEAKKEYDSTLHKLITARALNAAEVYTVFDQPTMIPTGFGAETLPETEGGMSREDYQPQGEAA